MDGIAWPCIAAALLLAGCAGTPAETTQDPAPTVAEPSPDPEPERQWPNQEEGQGERDAAKPQEPQALVEDTRACHVRAAAITAAVVGQWLNVGCAFGTQLPAWEPAPEQYRGAAGFENPAQSPRSIVEVHWSGAVGMTQAYLGVLGVAGDDPTVVRGVASPLRLEIGKAIEDDAVAYFGVEAAEVDLDVEVRITLFVPATGPEEAGSEEDPEGFGAARGRPPPALHLKG